MKENQTDFDMQIVLEKPLMAHLATTCAKGPRSSLLWFLYEDQKLWLFGTSKDSFVNRLRDELRCALSITDFDLKQGALLHMGIRGRANFQKVNERKLYRFVGKYLGKDQNQWNTWFVKNIVQPLDVMIEIQFEDIVAKDVSFF